MNESHIPSPCSSSISIIYIILHTHTHIYISIYIVGIRGPKRDIGSWVVSENIKLSENKKTLARTYKLVGCERILVVKGWECSPRIDTSLTKQGRGQRPNLSSRTMHQTVILIRISIKRE